MDYLKKETANCFEMFVHYTNLQNIVSKWTGVFRIGLVSELNGLVSKLELDKGGQYLLDLSLFSCPVTITAVRDYTG